MTIRPIAMRDAFLDRLCQAMAFDDKIFFVSADFGSPVLDRIREQFPNRFVNVGIAEQNLINISAGLATEGFKVFAYAIAPFITMRCYEQIRVNLVLLSTVRTLNVTLIGVGAGYSYVVSGPTHQCYEDLSIMRALPTMSVYSPADHVAAAALFETCLENNGPKYLRLDAQVLPVLYEESTPDMLQGFHQLRSGDDICLLATGYMVHTALKIAQELLSLDINATVIDLYDISHFDAKSLQTVLQGFPSIVTLEEGFRGRGGLDAMMFDWLAQRNMNIRLLNIGVEGSYRFELGSRTELHEQVGIGVHVVTQKVIKFLQTEGKYEISIDEKQYSS
ncbi:MAG: transketolase C-terminal domain-containing protein [Legionellaceae bacterium]|nr:transketolase C-terminal domain-containing protein [Legionellaceae bacterium]